MSSADKSRLIKRLATELGFDRVGIAATLPIEHGPYLEKWLAAGRAGSMAYLHRNRDIRSDPSRLVEGARNVIVLAASYSQSPPPAPVDDEPRGRVAMYAWGDDYHDILKRRLHDLADALHVAIDESFVTRCCVDTVPILERELAARAGVGWIGKNTMVLQRELGSYFFLGEIVTTLELDPDGPAVDHCGSCTSCIDACPTAAFPTAYEMDASRCISYLTIEHRDTIPEAFHPLMGDWIFGCDVCQQVCPFNRQPRPTRMFSIRSPGPQPSLDGIMRWSDEDYRRTLKGSAIKRAKLGMLKRNAAIAHDNICAP